MNDKARAEAEEEKAPAFGGKRTLWVPTEVLTRETGGKETALHESAEGHMARVGNAVGVSGSDGNKGGGTVIKTIIMATYMALEEYVLLISMLLSKK